MRIFVEGLEFVGPHGVYPEERVEGRRFRADLSVVVADDSGRRSDELGDTVDYRGLAECVLEVGHGPSVALIEHMGARILDLVLARYSTITHARLTLRKFATGVPGAPACVGVELERSRG